jgi:hypothetical protein
MRSGRFLKTVQWDEISQKEFALNSIGIITSRRDLQADSDHGTAQCV